MEHTIENAIDSGLESISAQLHMFGAGFGIVLMLFGIILLFIHKGPSGKKRFFLCGVICLILGMLATVSGFLQM